MLTILTQISNMGRVIALLTLFFMLFKTAKDYPAIITKFLQGASDSERIYCSVKLAIFTSFEFPKKIHQLGNFEIEVFFGNNINQRVNLMGGEFILASRKHGKFC